jgi:hypothetical protein
MDALLEFVRSCAWRNTFCASSAEVLSGKKVFFCQKCIQNGYGGNGMRI